MALISDGDLFCIERQGRSYKWTGSELNLQIQEISPIESITGDFPIVVQYSGRVVNISIRDGTINQKGAVKLTNTVNNSETLALTPKGAKIELDKKANLGGDNATGTWPINITGNAETSTHAGDSVNSENVYVRRDDNSNENRYINFVAGANAENKQLRIDNGLTYNPSLNTLTATTFKGNLNGTASKADQATNSTNAINSTNSTNVNVLTDGSNNERYLNFSSVTSGNTRVRADAGLRYNPSSNTIITTNLTLYRNLIADKVTTQDAIISDTLSVGSVTGTSIELSGEIKARSANILTGISAASANLSGVLTSNSINTVNIVASEVTAKNVTLTSKIKAATAEITGNLSASGISARTGNFSGNLSAANGTFSGNTSSVNATVSNKLNGKEASFSNNLTAKSVSISDKLTAGNIEASSGKITNTLTTGSLNTGLFTTTSGSVTNNLTVGSISGGAATFTGKLTAGSAQINGSLSTHSASISGALSASSAAISGGLTAASANISGKVSSDSVSTRSLSVTVDAHIGRNVNCSHIVAAQSLMSYGDTYVGGNLIVQKGTDHKATVFGNDGGAYFANEKIWLHGRGEVECINLDCRGNVKGYSASISGALWSGSVNTGPITSSSTVTATGKGQFGSVTTGTVTASTVDVSSDLNVSGKVSSDSVSTRSLSVTVDAHIGRNVNCSHIVAAQSLMSYGDTYVGGNLIVQKGTDHKAVIFSDDGGAYFANEKIWLQGNGDVKFNKVTCDNVVSVGNITAIDGTLTNLRVNGSATVGGSITSDGGITSRTGLTGSYLFSYGDAYIGRDLIVQKGTDHKAKIFGNDGGAYFANEKIWLHGRGEVECINLDCRGNIKAIDITARSATLSGNLTVSGALSSDSVSTQNLSVSVDANIGGNVNCSHIVAAKALLSYGDTYVGGNFILQTGNDQKAVIFNDGGAYFANEKIWLHGSGDIECRDLNSKSDRRFKTDIQPVTDALTSLKKLNGVNFKWTDTGDKSMGVIAQDVEEVFPELVSEREEFKSVNYNGLIGALIEAVKELSTRVEELENTK